MQFFVINVLFQYHDRIAAFPSVAPAECAPTVRSWVQKMCEYFKFAENKMSVGISQQHDCRAGTPEKKPGAILESVPPERQKLLFFSLTLTEPGE